MGLIDKDRPRHQNNCQHRIKHPKISLNQITNGRFKKLQLRPLLILITNSVAKLDPLKTSYSWSVYRSIVDTPRHPSRVQTKCHDSMFCTRI